MDKEEVLELIKKNLSVSVYVETGDSYFGERAKTVRVKVTLVLDGEIISEDSDVVSVD